MARVLFLDVDGVLNHSGSYTGNALGAQPIEPDAVALLNEVIDATGCYIVLSSSWRGMGELEDKLRACGALRHVYPMDWRTPRLESVTKGGVIVATVRGNEIATWLQCHPDVERYAIVDDDSDMLPEQKPFFVQTSFTGGGLQRHHADQLIELLADAPLRDRLGEAMR